MQISRTPIVLVAVASLMVPLEVNRCRAQPGSGDGAAVLRNPFDVPAAGGGTSGNGNVHASPSSVLADHVTYKELMAALLADARYAINRDVQPTPELGPWMICVHSYVVKEAPEYARQFCAELRSTYRLPAYVFTYGLEERRKEMERVQAVLEKQRQFFKEKNLEVMYTPRSRDGSVTPIVTDDVPTAYALQLLKDVQHIQVQCAVLVGGYPSEDAAHRALTTIRKLPQPDPNKVKLDVKFYGSEDPMNQGKLKFKSGAAEYVNPFQRAFVCRNPALKVEKNNDPKDGLDLKVLQKWNSEEPYSLLQCKKPITLAIKQFQTFTTIQAADDAKRVFDTLG
ncbi:MAG: hypothetical protein NZO58_06030, partial [Gemmataceae bacterium]|nr:hypothetical protein [Gemmataceae bacterium]